MVESDLKHIQNLQAKDQNHKVVMDYLGWATGSILAILLLLLLFG